MIKKSELYNPKEDLIGTILSSWRNRSVLKFIKGRLLDVACGDNRLVKKYGNGVGVDINDYNADIVLKNFYALPFKDDSFNTVAIVASLNYFDNPQRILFETKRILKDGGRLIVTMPNNTALNFFSKIRPSCSERTILSQEEIILLLGDIGFKMVRKVKFMAGLNNIYVAENIQKHRPQNASAFGGEYRKTIRKFYNNFADKWDSRFRGSRAFNYFLNERIKRLKEALGYNYNNILDAGCGTGFYIMKLLDRSNKKGLGFDFAEKMIEVARRNKERYYPDLSVEFRVDDGENLNIEDNSFDRVMHTGYLIHVGDQQKAVSEIFRVLKPEGKMVGLVSNRRSPWMWLGLRYFFGKNIGVVEGDKELTSKELKKSLLKSGFKNISISYFNTLPGKTPDWLYWPARFLNLIFKIYPISLFSWHILVVAEKPKILNNKK